jgi:hypothetical protein
MLMMIYAFLDVMDERITADIKSIISGLQEEKEELKHGVD